ncbi:hypothetical protein BT63DRAFT_460204 [Microthyrium microscopicum]|uniref:Uncharacterized protein n=1 Tax=Microthyrium microscopicum TaxID=703497 RepID=A0A6A6TZG7_9PEZI|nr:hypothetical protein BT63DRAFT_460204 [Microthyrium microscopicum]
MGHVGSYEDGARLNEVKKPIEAIQSRLWSGLSPMTGEQWKQKNGDGTVNLQMAAEYLRALISAFSYLNSDVVNWKLRDTYNPIFNDLLEVGNALAEHCDEKPLCRFRYRFRAIWASCVRTSFRLWLFERTRGSSTELKSLYE